MVSLSPFIFEALSNKTNDGFQFSRASITNISQDQISRSDMTQPKALRFSGASRYTIVINPSIPQNGSEGKQGLGEPTIAEPATNVRRSYPYYDIFCMEIAAGYGKRVWSKGKYMENEPKDRLDLWHEESHPYNLEELFHFTEKNKKFDVYARDPRSDLIPGTKYELYLSVWLFTTATEWKHPLEVRGKGVLDIVSSTRLPTDTRNPIIDASWANFVVAEFTATNATRLVFHIYDTTAQTMDNFYIRGFGYYPL